MTSPSAFARRTPLSRHLERQNATWRALSDAAIAETVPGEPDPRHLALIDLSPLPRIGFKGRGTIAAVQKRGIVLEATPNRAFSQPGGGLCLVLAPSEVLLLSSIKGAGSPLYGSEESWQLETDERTFPLPRRESHAWLMATGRAAPAMLAKLCAIDFRRHKFPNLSIAQTSLAKLTAIITRSDIGQTPAFHILADSASALYLCLTLIDAGHEFGGGLAGLAGLEELEVHEATQGHSQ